MWLFDKLKYEKEYTRKLKEFRDGLKKIVRRMSVNKG